ncbi:tRNA epoxyqueuosine(34) reductase QueG [Desulfuribacillus stibiiarsenatis]|uniref:tRNA epoxyqueuosine(34) reductase QueG n=1 Tax=Desulfuribacillus stibiiarsenatis TaxID=1390249 RepID=A0A1E5L9E7_9FIRM|nr:tRNA epoxyqueuosine(34) reductase QueG [Desulfuribacillus stibiiarsenatis]OEH86619.1 tRNA epoxyqueuosine(34) reductase QueG [Desulfuribacillus stibiiarsenatis]
MGSDSRRKIVDFSREIEIDAIGFASVAEFAHIRDYLAEHRSLNHHTGWEEADIEKRIHPSTHLPHAKTIIVIAISYHAPETNEQWTNQEKLTRGRLAKIAWGQDYHKVVLNKLHQLESFIHSSIDGTASNLAFVDTGPLVDREVAIRAGIGFYGYNCNIIHPHLGSYIVIGSLLTTLQLPTDTQLQAECMTCNKCVNACPTGALYEPYRLNSQRCLAYLTLTKGEMGDDYQENLDNHIYGCDICQSVCPHNKRAPHHNHQEFNELDEIKYPDLIELLHISNQTFRHKYGHSSGAWRGKKPWQRNALLLIGKRKITAAIPALQEMIEKDPRTDMRELARNILNQFSMKSVD